MTPSPRVRLTLAELKPLTVRRNLPAALRIVVHLGSIMLGAALLWRLLGTAWALPMTLVLAWPVAFLFNVLHETAHQTAFRTRWPNLAFGHLAAFAILLPYEYYRAFHWDHHRYTNDPRHDPELAMSLPRTRLRLAWYLSGLPTWIGRVRMLLVHGLLGRADERWVPEARRATIVREARAYLAGYALIIVVAVWAQSLAAVWLWILPVMVGQWVMRPYLLAEHTGCAHTGDMLETTRTTYTNALVHCFAWNMPYHAEHHAYPAVPFHSLPALNRLLAPHLVNTEPGYLKATEVVMSHLSARVREGESRAGTAG